MLDRMEKLGWVSSAELWVTMRSIRNKIVHDYLPEQVARMFAQIAGPFAAELSRLEARVAERLAGAWQAAAFASPPIQRCREHLVERGYRTLSAGETPMHRPRPLHGGTAFGTPHRAHRRRRGAATTPSGAAPTALIASLPGEAQRK
ncbi:MAG: hypothetical protein MUD07_10630 [Burkholderiaceae bacterium]|jgi:hypothetical protein|nr:hypothetical protein [Burkholderiaceae bacterium]